MAAKKRTVKIRKSTYDNEERAVKKRQNKRGRKADEVGKADGRRQGGYLCKGWDES